MTVCEKHRKTPAKGYSPCPGCEVERLQERLAIAERALTDLGVTPAEAKAGVSRSTANQKDAERYRWLRTYRPGLLLDMLTGPSAPNDQWADDLDAVIDSEVATAMHANP